MINVCIVGVGLIGGSLGLALRRVRRRGKKIYHVMGWGRNRRHLIVAKKRGAVDEIVDKAVALIHADMVVLCVPVQIIVPVARRLLPFLKRGVVLTDVGSVKDEIVRGMDRLPLKRKNLSYVGAHPIAGSEKTGVHNADARLFVKATCVLTRDRRNPASFQKVKKMWSSVGARCVSLSPKEHDRGLAMTSHLPHLLAFALFSLVYSEARRSAFLRKLTAGSFRDMTRIAASDGEIWSGILKLNKKEIARVKNIFVRGLDQLLREHPNHLTVSLQQIASAKNRW